MKPVNACFISYRHTNDPDAHQFVMAFVRQLKKQLGWWLPGVPIFFDEKGLNVGDQYNEELAYQLCHSACMVLFFLLSISILAILTAPSSIMRCSNWKDVVWDRRWAIICATRD
ncbi:MAG: toll/interleukin-1 receptor domain-containing protein [Desulfobulbaceae bacterium]|nr:toll/interleukin-1 receptor domain-containing protein [Desulfobulbaceae bacterium]